MMTDRLKLARKFLRGHWRKREYAAGRLPGDKPSFGQCDFSACFLANLLGGELQGGFSYKAGVKQEGGLDGELHYWTLLQGGEIVDITADQFGYPEVVVAAPGSDLHRSYVCSFTPDELGKVESFWADQCSRLVPRFLRYEQLYADAEPTYSFA
jgi:hypothetical protein